MMSDLLHEKLMACIQKKENWLKDLSALDHFLSRYWEDQIKLYSELDEACKLIEMRNIAEAMLSNLEKMDLYNAPDITLWNGLELPFYYVRHLCFSGYLILTWNIYDRLTSFYVRMMAPYEISDKKQIPSLQKLFENQEIRKKFSAFGTAQISDEFLPYINISYAIRNTLAHEGNNYRNIPMFKDNKTPKFAFAPNEDFLKILSSSIAHDDSVIKNDINACHDLKDLLFKCNLKIDALLASLITHASDCFCAHLNAWHKF